MWQFIQDYGSWIALALIYLFMLRMHMGGGHSMHGSSSPQGAAPQAGGGRQHGAQPTATPNEQENQSGGNMGNVDNGTSSAASAGQTKQSPSAHRGCH